MTVILFQKARHGFGWQIGRLYGYVFHIKGCHFYCPIGIEEKVNDNT